MTTDKYLPVTEATAIENKIGNSVKISKQLMKSQLKAKIKETREQLDNHTKTYTDMVNKFKEEAEASIRGQILLSMSNDSEFSRFRNFYNKFSAYSKKDSSYFAATNMELIDSISVYSPIRDMLRNELKGEDLKDFTKHQLLEIQVDLKIFDYDGEDYLGYTQKVHINDDLIGQLANIEKFVDVLNTYTAKYTELSEKLDNIDAVAEEMEAQLLVQELNKTEDGKEALKLAGNLVGGMLGETPELLNIK